jgi:hypothetical protein
MCARFRPPEFQDDQRAVAAGDSLFSEFFCEFRFAADDGSVALVQAPIERSQLGGSSTIDQQIPQH